jgi:hypothetical protein
MYVMCKKWCKVEKKLIIKGKEFVKKKEVDVSVVKLKKMVKKKIKINLKVVEKVM